MPSKRYKIMSLKLNLKVVISLPSEKTIKTWIKFANLLWRWVMLFPVLGGSAPRPR